MTVPAAVPWPPFDPADLSIRELLASYVAILDELRRRGLVRTRKSPLGDLAESLAMRAYGGSLAPNSEKSYDLIADDGRRIQVKARTVRADDKRTQNFSAVRSWEFDAALFLLFDAATYDLIWVRELDRDQTQSLGRRVEHTNSSAILVRDVAHAGADVTALVRAAYDRIDKATA
ncbi:hypothetical protein Q7F20_01395 [Curtobacterium sp. A7_M15]|uniref:DUF6998 domain-containing protein n=1 Tax=Curtobacterium sp. A7_M15 TaxID=3065241 RepID=UPI002737BA00|nr:hypothetical protein [Curtobacterium sp. A7_M15]MDP4332013.1 hypothetical protein [Curtobacterium sp. A7_M15]